MPRLNRTGSSGVEPCVVVQVRVRSPQLALPRPSHNHLGKLFNLSLLFDQADVNLTVPRFLFICGLLGGGGFALSTAAGVKVAIAPAIAVTASASTLAGSRNFQEKNMIWSMRMRGMVDHQEVILGALGQSLTIRQDSYDRTSFMPGVVLACKQIADHPGLTLGLDSLLDI